MKMTELDRAKEVGIYVKVSYKDEIRKFKIVDYEKPYDDILNVLSHQYELDTYNNKNIRLSYIDDDLDEITVSSNREVADALNTFHKNGCCIKLKIKEGILEQESGSESGDGMGLQPHMTPNSPCAGDTDQEKSTDIIMADETESAQKEESDVTSTESLQKEIDKVITGVIGGRNPGEEPLIVPNIFSTFQGKTRRQFEIDGGLVVCRICPAARTMQPTVDLNVMKAHTKSDFHIMALTYHVLGEWPGLTSAATSLTPLDLLKQHQDRWKLLDNTAAQLLSAKCQQHLATSNTAKPLGQRRKRTSFSPATTISLEKFANSIGWKRGESEKINEFAQKHGLTFYQVKVWMNNHRPRKNLTSGTTNSLHGANNHPAPTTTTSSTRYSNLHRTSSTVPTSPTSVDHTKEINKSYRQVIAALEEPLKLARPEGLDIASNPLVSNLAFGTNLLAGSPFALPPAMLPVSGPALSLPSTLATPLSLPSAPLSLSSSLGLFHPTSSSLLSNGGSISPKSEPVSPKTSPCISPFFSSRFSTQDAKAEPSSSSNSDMVPEQASLDGSTIPAVVTSAVTSAVTSSGSFTGVPKASVAHPLSLDNVSLDSAFRPPAFTPSLHSIFSRQESTSSGS